MKPSLIAATVVAVAALTSVAASAEIYNPYLFDQMQAPATKTRAEVKAEVLQALREGAPASSSYNGASQAKKAGAAPQAAPDQVKTSE